MKLLVQDFVKNNSLGKLYEMHGVEVSFSKDGTKISFNYSQIKSKESDKLACQCRGLVLALKSGKSIYEFPEFKIVNGSKQTKDIILGDTVIVSYGFDRFFNYGQSTAYVDFNKEIKVYEKLDGTCIFVYFHNKWNIATRSSPEADIEMGNSLYENYTFSSLFKKCIKDTIGISFEEYTKTLDKNITYVFELTSPQNKIVVNYNNYRATLLAARNKISFKEYNIEEMNNLVPCVNYFDIKKIEDIISFVKERKAFEHEGVVIKDSDFNRVKIKNPEYIILNKARDLLSKSKRGIISIILSEKEDDLIPYLAEDIVNEINLFKEKLSNFIDKVDSNYKKYIDEVNLYPDSEKNKRKRFAELVNLNEKYVAPFFQIYSGKASNMKDFLSKNNKDGWSDSFIDNIIEAIK